MLLALLGACGPRNNTLPILTVAAQDCAVAPALAKATSLPFNGKDASTQSLAMTDTTPCLSDGKGRKRLYAVFQLPETNRIPYTVSVASIAQGNVVFALQITLLNAQGEPVRDIGAETLQFRGGSLTGLFRPHPGEQYLLVTSNPDAVGRHFSRIAQNVSSNVVGSGTMYANIYTGSDTTTDYMFSHSGKIDITIDPVPAKG
jgi:hypothetical protein